MASGRRVRERLLHAWGHMRAGKTPLIVATPGTNVVPLFSRSHESGLAAEAASWLRRYLRPGIRRGSLEDEEAEALGLYLSLKSGMLSSYESINHYLRLRAERSREKSFSAIEKEFFRRVSKAVRTIKAGLARDGVHVCPAPGTKVEPKEVSERCA